MEKVKTSVETICKLLVRSRLMKPEQFQPMFQKWRAAAGAASGNVGQFCKWLVAKKYVTAYQVRLLAAGYSDHFFLNEYTILDRIGAGKMAGVYKARHWVGQVVAIKVLPPSKGKDHHAFTRFRREARLAIKMKHPNLVRTFERDEADGLHYLVMDLLEGETLKDLVERCGKIPPLEAVELIHQALLGLQHIYENDVVHRDLDPGNLMLVPEPHPDIPDHQGPTVKILDIGLGRSLFEDAKAVGEGDGLTVTGEVLGKPEYMAPEQARDSHAVDIRADIYSMGCILHFAVTGQPPFVESNAVKLMIRHAKDMPPPLANFESDLPEGLQEVVTKMVAKAPSQRYPTPEVAAQALEKILKAPKKAKRQAAKRHDEDDRQASRAYDEDDQKSVLVDFRKAFTGDKETFWKYMEIIEKEGKGRDEDED